jgi:methionine-S-sulfoxide reductase
MINRIVLAGGCFWTTEAVFRLIEGVVQVTSGYAGGESDNPSFEAVSTGSTGHAECVEIKYRSDITTLEHLLEVFWYAHNPTELNRQGPDIGTQYRSAIYYSNPDDISIINYSVQNIIKRLNTPIATEVRHIGSAQFYPADIYHQNYYHKHRQGIYSKAIIIPKLEKIEKLYGKKNKVFL